MLHPTTPRVGGLHREKNRYGSGVIELPNQTTPFFSGKSLEMIINLHCFHPPNMGTLMTPVVRISVDLFSSQSSKGVGAPTFFDGHLRPQDFHDDFNDNAQKMLPLGRFAFIKKKMLEFTSANSTLNMLNIQFHNLPCYPKSKQKKNNSKQILKMRGTKGYTSRHFTN